MPQPMRLSRGPTSRKPSKNLAIPPVCHNEVSLFLVAPTRLAVALAKPDRFRAGRQLFLMNLNLHARHFISPGWTNAVQPKNYFANNAL